MHLAAHFLTKRRASYLLGCIEMFDDRSETSKSSKGIFQRRFLVDISTSWHMAGSNAMGILRTERELTRRLLTDPALHSLPIVFWNDKIYAVALDEALTFLAAPMSSSCSTNSSISPKSVRPSKRAWIFRLGSSLLGKIALWLFRIAPARTHNDLMMCLRHGKRVIRALLSPSSDTDSNLSPPKQVANFSLIVHPSGDDILWTCGHYSHCIPLRSIAEEKRRHGFSVAATCYDLIRIRNPQWNPQDMAADIFVANTIDLLDSADTIFCISDYVLADLRKFAAEVGRSPPRLRRITLGSDMVSRQYKADKPVRPFPECYAIAVGTVEPRKNYGLLIRVWQKLSSDSRFHMHLIIVGKQGYQAETSVDEIQSATNLDTKIHWLQDIPDSELKQLYQGAQVLLYPSLDEGWGLPVAEALSVGCPVISSDRGALPEAGHGLSTLLDPLDDRAWEIAIREAMQSSVRNLPPASMPTWDDAANSLRAEMSAIFVSPKGFNESSTT